MCVKWIYLEVIRQICKIVLALHKTSSSQLICRESHILPFFVKNESLSKAKFPYLLKNLYISSFDVFELSILYIFVVN